MPPDRPDWRVPDGSFRPFHRMMREIADAQAATFQVEGRYRHVARLETSNGHRHWIHGTSLGLNSDAAAAIASDKTYAANLLDEAGLNTPNGIVAVAPRFKQALALKNAAVAAAIPDLADTLAFARDLGFPVYVKPNRGAEGRLVSKAHSEEELAADLTALFAEDTHARVEATCPGDDVRVLVFDGQVRAAYTRRSLCLTGDGRSTVGNLLAGRLEAFASQHRGAKVDPTDARITRMLKAQGLGLTSTPDAGRRVTLLPGANLSTGGELEDLSASLNDDLQDIALRAAQTLGLRWAGVDLLVPDAGDDDAQPTVLEVNSAPGMDFYASSSPQNMARARAILTDLVVALLR